MRIAPTCAIARRYRRSLGTSDGSIIATIIAIHMERNHVALASQVRPGIRIHAIERVQPPGIAIPPLADIVAHQAAVIAALPAKSSTARPRKAR
jgi:hypothetical protein